MSEKILIDKLISLFIPVVEALGYELYHVEYVNEEDENFLRIYIDHEDGVDIDDCATVSRKISDLLDEVDPIEESYYLEISSSGVERQLFTDKHLEDYIGSDVTIELLEKINGKDNIIGELVEFTEDLITLKVKGAKRSVKRDNILKVNLKIEF